MGTKKILLLLSLILFVIIILEGVYLFNLKSNENKTESAATNISPSPSPSQAQASLYPNAAISKEKIDSISSSIENLQVFKEGVLQEAILTYKLEGVIVKKESVLRQDEDGKEVEVESLEIKGTEGYTNTFFYSPERLETVTVQERTEDGLEPISFESLQVNDEISMTYNVDVLEKLDYDSTIKGVTIIKE